MLEVLASGAILAVMLAGTISVVAAERRDVSRAANRAKAAALAEDLMGRLLADAGPTKAYDTSGSWVQDDPSATEYPGFTRRYQTASIANATDTELGSLWELRVEVTYPGVGGNDKAIEHVALRRDRFYVMSVP